MDLGQQAVSRVLWVGMTEGCWAAGGKYYCASPSYPTPFWDNLGEVRAAGTPQVSAKNKFKLLVTHSARLISDFGGGEWAGWRPGITLDNPTRVNLRA